MPSPSKAALVSGLIFTGGLMYAGAWLASGMSSTSDAEEPDETMREMPLLAPIPGAEAQALMLYPDSAPQAYAEHDARIHRAEAASHEGR